MTPAIRRRRTALFVLFLIPGLLLASWVTRTPDIRDLLSASTSEMGMILFGLSLGAMLGVLASGRLVSRVGTRPVIGGGLVLVYLGFLAIAGASTASLAMGVFAGLFLFGLGLGLSDIAINIEGAELETTTRKPLLPALHGCFSLGTLAGSLISLGLTHLSLPVFWHLILMGAATLLPCIWACLAIPPGTGQTHTTSKAEQPPAMPFRPWKDKTLIMIGLIVLALALAEGSATDWLPLLMVDGHGFDPASSALVYAGFTTAMTIGRFSGTYILQRFSREAVIRASALSGALGIALVSFSDNPILAAASVLFWGLGASLGFPVGISAAGDSGEQSAKRVAAVATVGYLAFLIGPPSLGFIGQAYGLRMAMVVVLVLVAATVLLAPAVRDSRLHPERRIKEACHE
ncbi:MFS transporter [Pseudomonas sp. LTJR-52]|uniref:MFS transporter n=1 Tax=Pseudomonas sp. LTJR-52 TaxID=2479392 RepID=UPI000EFCE31B|nr:MFS transporter [Pseudomonas sp. LTJR-52]AYN96304.1 MFS transporter [Pseudomonas sp. LTJR-52]